MNRRKFIGYIGCTCGSLLLNQCTTAPITGRRQLSVYPEGLANKHAAQYYDNFKSKNKLKKSGKELDDVTEIAEKIIKGINIYFRRENLPDPTKLFQWEYIVVDNDKVLNAFCAAGGKIAVYTGIYKLAENKNELSIIMGHEIAHAVAKHTIEKQSTVMSVHYGSAIADIFLGGVISRTRNTVGNTTGIDIFRTGLLDPFSRKMETEADYLGLIFSSLAGYDIRVATSFWEKMKEKNKGKEPPQFLSTHPSSKNRIKNLKNWIPEIILKYPPIS